MTKTGTHDPLYVIFEQHLYNFQDSDADRKTFIQNIVIEYLGYLRHRQVVIPKPLEASVAEELANQVNTMLVKKIYGNLTVSEHLTKAKPETKRAARQRYSSLARKKS